MKKNSGKKVVYSINVEDLQKVSQEVLDRDLNEKEIVLIQGSMGDRIDWFQAIEQAILQAVPR